MQCTSVRTSCKFIMRLPENWQQTQNEFLSRTGQGRRSIYLCLIGRLEITVVCIATDKHTGVYRPWGNIQAALQIHEFCTCEAREYGERIPISPPCTVSTA